MTYLVVDDEVAICEGTVRRMQQIDPTAEVLCAFSGEEALGLFDERDIDFLITDIRMGDMDGLSLIARAKEKNGLLAAIIITAYDSFTYAQRALRLGANDFLVKPYTQDALRETVERVNAWLDTARRSARARLDAMISRLISGGSDEIDLSHLKSAGVKARRLHARAALLSASESPAWRGEWCYKTSDGRACLLSDDDFALRTWFADMPAGVRAGVSLPGTPDAERFSQAGKALGVSALEGQPQCVVYDSAFENGDLMKRDSLVLWAMSYVALNAGKKMDMRGICQKLHINYSYFSRLFSEQAGETFSEYLLAAQMKWAASKMSAGMRVGEAARALGYQNADSFARAFAKVYGSSPRAWLSKNAGG